jgi:hypothetical protein
LHVKVTELDRRLAAQRGAEKVTRGYTSKVLNGQIPPLDYAESLALALGVRPAWLLAGDGEMLPGADAPTYASLPGWRFAAHAALEQLPRNVPPYAIEAAASRPVIAAPKAVTPALVIALAKFWFEFASDEEVSRAEAATVPQRTGR